MGAAAGAIDVAMAGVAGEASAGIGMELALAAAWGAGGVLVGALGEAGASTIEGGTTGATTPAGYDAGSPASPVVTTASPAAATQRPMIVNIHVNGLNYGLDTDKLARDIYPSIRKAIDDGVH
jgi:hypothetical protein